MFGMIYQQMQIVFAQTINKLIYTIRKLPFVGKIISEEIYAMVSVKRTLCVVAAILSAFKDIFSKMFYFIFAICIWGFAFVGYLTPDSLFANKDSILLHQYLSMSIFWIFFFMNFLLGSFLNSRICACDEKDYLFVGLLRIDARKYFLLKMFKSQIIQIVYYTVFMLIIQCVILDGDIKTTLLYMIGFATFRFIGESFRLYLNDKFGMPFTVKNKALNVIYNFYCVAIFLVAYVTFFILLFLKYPMKIKGIVFPDICVVVTNPVFLIAAVILAIISIRYIVRYQNYPFVAKRLAGFNTVMEQKEAADKVSKVNKNIEVDELDKKEAGKRVFEEKQGYEYLNAIFFERHKKIFTRPIRIKTAVSAVLMAVSIIALVVYKLNSPIKEFQTFSNDLWKAMDKIITILVFIMYCITSGRNITKALFYNCDHSLLKYGYYRKPEAILKNFRIRLRFMIKSELPMVSVLCIGFIIDTVLLGKIDQWLKLLSIVGCIIMLSVFYSVVYLCMYYIFQPYTEGGEETGIGYGICKGIIYVMSYICLQIDTIPQYFVLIVVGVTILGIIAAYALAYLMAPKRFVLK